MMKKILARTVALTLAGAGLALAQQSSPREMRGSRLSTEDVAAFADARIAGLKAGLKLTAEQEKNWPAVEAAIRELAKERADRIKARVRREPRRGGGDNAQQPRPDALGAPSSGRGRDDHACGQPEETRRCRRAALQEPGRRPEAPLRSSTAHGRGRSGHWQRRADNPR